MTLRTITEIKNSIESPKIERHTKPDYFDLGNTKLAALAVSSMKHHMTDEGWQIMKGLSQNGYELFGSGIGNNETDVEKILDQNDIKTLVVQDIREWDRTRDFRDQSAYFENTELLKNRSDIFKLTILKDAHQRPAYHFEFNERIGCHAWIIYYNKEIVTHLAPYIRKEHIIETTHSIDRSIIPPINKKCNRPGTALLSGAMNRKVYPLRERIKHYCKIGFCDSIDWKKHPGYHRAGCETPEYLQILNNYKVAICTSSIYGYCLRKIIEATACGCRVITDLPINSIQHDCLETNLLRIPSDITHHELNSTIDLLCDSYNDETQMQIAKNVASYFDYRKVTQRLAIDIENLRRNY